VVRTHPGPAVGPAAYPDDVTSARRSAAFFDLDKTVIARSSTLAFSRPFYAGGLITRSAVLRGAYAHFLFLVGGADHDQTERMREYLSRMVAGWDVQQVRDIVAQTLAEVVEPVVYREATALIDEHHRLGRDVVIVSASGAEVVEPIGALIGADHVVATRMVVVAGRYTGDIAFYAYGEAKADAMRRLAAEHGYDLADCHAYSDSVTDLPMLLAVGHPTVVNPDRALRREATTRGWPILHFTEPVTLATRVAGGVQRVDTWRRTAWSPTLEVVPRAAAVRVAVAAGPLVAALAWFVVRRRRQAREPTLESSDGLSSGLSREVPG
jgi:HAD superfamily hydrolase (TIGR01490 family)